MGGLKSVRSGFCELARWRKGQRGGEPGEAWDNVDAADKESERLSARWDGRGVGCEERKVRAGERW